jgi:hypothetical protein
MDTIREKKDKFPETLWMSAGTRGAMIGRLEEAIKTTADDIGLPLGNGRDIRLRLTSEVYLRDIHSFNELTDAELWALDQWVLEGANGLQDWLRQAYGVQVPMFV